jgi:hypothetical protein
MPIKSSWLQKKRLIKFYDEAKLLKKSQVADLHKEIEEFLPYEVTATNS